MTGSFRYQPLRAVAALLMVAAVALRLLLPAVPAWAPALILLSAVVIGAVSMRGGTTDCTTAPPAVQRRYVRDMTTGMVGYMALLFASLLLLRVVEVPTLRALIALLPVAPIGLLLRAMLRFIRGVDELQQRIELEAICIAAALVSFGYMTGGFLQAAQVIDVPASAAMLWVFPLVCGLYGIAKSVVARRYR
ncbi:hypothetical protein [Luteimonas sp. S4-F44]|uniref:hypothetical protein n=1 Tax=Luteimonas sp. S4-F44 TaxID=2925842 RepID=UPI0031BA973A